MKNVLTIIKKEFTRFFKDRRMLISIFIPGIVIFLLYTVMGSVFSDIGKVDEGYKPTACVINLPQENAAMSGAIGSSFAIGEEKLSEEQAKKKVEEGALDVLIVFPENFSGSVADGLKPEISVYYNISNDKSSYGYNLATALLTQFENPDFTVNTADKKYNLAEDDKTTGQILSMVMPMLILALLASSCIALAPEAIAGEKERGTMATMLITPIKRWQLALGKILSLAFFALLSGISSFLGVILSLPKLMNGMVGAETAAMYGFGDYMMILGVIVSVVLLIISAFSVLSCFAKSVKEAGSLITPLMMVIILLGVFSMFAGNTPSVALYLIPLMGSALSISSVMSFAAQPLAVILSIVSNLVVTAVLVVVLALMFNSEKVMFKR